ncbi:hypothetical protein bcgnr5378_37860 [Bacillus cereus]|uniref:Uncharacterized protein n=1 Tax=Bacillus cereus TaxID=1396 RepID=A0A161SUT1_BACCE|nr:hypothetical protein [Bacillus cereus]KZD71885.1 hypothetical protein B4088_0346 [Bacillus cereus]HDR8320440.1 hypothetical protein [Bacillus cereus]HDR8331627.1 hypothetical protein [Bacillus cereus]HDR8335958.1 hypothetical protein [Bacillus cereus]
MKKTYFSLITFITAAFFTFYPYNVSAAENAPAPDKFGINVSPAEITIQDKINTNGDTKHFEVTVTNPGTKEQTFKVIPERLIQPDITTFKLKPGQKQKIKFHFDLSNGYDSKTKKEKITFISSNEQNQTINANINVNFSINSNDTSPFKVIYLLFLLLLPAGYLFYRKKKKSN